MQRGRTISESIHNIVDLNQPPVSSTSNVNLSTAMWGNMVNPGRHDTAKSTSAAQDQVHAEHSTIGRYWFPPTSASSTSRSNHGGNHVAKIVPNLFGSGSDHCPWNRESRGTYMGSGDGRLHSASPNSCISGKEKHERLTYGPSFNDHGASSSTSGYLISNGDKSGSSLFCSGKIKAPEGGHSQLYSGGSSSSHVQVKNNFMQNTIPAFPSASGSITAAPSLMHRSFIGQLEQLNRKPCTGNRESYSESSRAHLYTGASSSSRVPAETVMQHTIPTSRDALAINTTHASPMEWSFTSQPEQLNLRIGSEEWDAYSEFFPPPNITDIAENAAGNIDERLSVGQQEPNSFVFPWTDTALGPCGSSSANQLSRSFWSTDSSLMINSSNPSSQFHEFLIPENTGSMQPSSQSGSLDPQSGRPRKVLRLSGSRSTAFRDEQNSRISLRSHSDLPASDTTSLSKHLLQDSPPLNLASGNTHPSESLLPSSRSGSVLSMQNLHTGWTPQNWIGPKQQGVAPQPPFQPQLHVYRSQRGHFPVIPPTPSSLMEGVIPSFSSQGRQVRSVSSLFIREQTDPINRQRGLAVDTEARQIQNVTIGVPEPHDRHSDMRLDIDNMSYEELLALEERIGNVCTGFSDKVIKKSMKRRKHRPLRSSSNSEPCCICQEEFVTGDEIGATACEHEFHFKCIKQWLSVKNTCPICKKTALDT